MVTAFEGKYGLIAFTEAEAESSLLVQLLNKMSDSFLPIRVVPCDGAIFCEFLAINISKSTSRCQSKALPYPLYRACDNEAKTA